ncbi:putative transposase [Parafrankia irregularis]|uniref:Putative transposase n=1 Tax=Parafrankia irregularis TaxID=795642 RepID=A0A0S4R112_9ACTN|nr:MULTISPECIES: transposase [Parafrankia]CUU61054.1 putative transposase [Parafrankia irregularis]
MFEDEAGQNLRPPVARTWAPRGRTPTVRVCGRGSGRVSMAAAVCYRPGQRPRLSYRLAAHRGRVGERRSFAEDDYATLITAAHHQLRAPIILCWDNLNTHRSQTMRQFLTAHTDWLTVVALPAYAPELNPTEGVWAHVKRQLANHTAWIVDQLAATVKTLLKRIQYRPELIDGFLGQTGLELDPQPP